MQVKSADHTGKQEVVRLEIRDFEAEAECSFEFRKQRFCWDAQDNCFHKLRSPTKVCPALPSVLVQDLPCAGPKCEPSLRPEFSLKHRSSHAMQVCTTCMDKKHSKD